MTKFSLGLLSVLLLTSCNLFKSSDLYVAVAKSKAREGSENQQSLEKVRDLLVQRGVHYKSVKFRYEVVPRTPLSAMNKQDAFSGETPLTIRRGRRVVRERKGIIYRDDTNPGEPWWYVDAEVRRPIWVPTDHLAMQVSFAMHRKIELLQIRDFDPPAPGLAKDPVPTSAVLESGPDWNERFRRANGTDFDPGSPVDVAKMRLLRSR